MGKDIQWEDAPEVKWEDAPEDESTLNKLHHKAMASRFGPAGEVAANFVTGIPGALAGGLTYLGALGLTQDPEAAMATKQGVEKAINDKIQYESQDEDGKKAQELVNKGFHKVIEGGGPVFDTMVSGLPIIGKDFSNHEANQAFGKAYTEMALNVAPIEGIAGMRRGAKAGEAAHIEAADKLEALNKKAEPQWEDAPVENPTYENGIPYEPLETVDANGGDTHPGVSFSEFQRRADEGPQPDTQLQNSAGQLDMPSVDMDKFELTPKAEEPRANTYEKGEVGSRDQARAKTEDLAKEEMANLAANRTKQWQQEEAYGALEHRKNADYSRMEAQKELDFADTAEKVQNSPGRSFFLDPANMDKVDFHSDHDFVNEAIGDKSLMAPEHSTAMAEHLVSGRIPEALGIIARNHEYLSYRKLASYLMDKLEGINLRVHDEGILEIGDRHATGYYDPTTRTVGLSKVGAVSPHTVLHELVHAITSDFMNSRPNDLRVMGIKDLFNKLNDLGMQKEFPQIVNTKEFLAEAFSNPEFQKFLKDHTVANRSMWRRFVDNVKSILGFSSATRNDITNALEHTLDIGMQIAEAKDGGQMAAFKDAGMPSKLSDLMVTRKKRPEPVNTRNAEDVQRLKIPGLEGPISDFTFYDKPMSEIVNMAKKADDIPNTWLEKMSHELQAGGLFESLKTRNPVVKYTYERLWRASQEAERNIKETMTHPETGLVPKMRELSLDEKGEIWAVSMLHEGDRVLSGQELREAGFNEKQVAYYLKERELNDRIFEEINQARANIGLRPMDKRVAHIAGRFTGDFSQFIFKDEVNPKTGKVETKIVGRIAGNTRGELNKVSKYIAKNHPEYRMGKREYNTLGRSKKPADRFTGLMEAINFLTKTDSDAAALFESYRDYMQRDAVNYLNATRHAKAKVRDNGGVMGSEGNKPWEDTKKNAEEGMKAQVAYYEQSYKWIAMEKAVNDLKPLLGDEEVVKQTPNAVAWAEAYKAHALGRIDSPVANAGNWAISKIGELTGVGHTNIFKYTNLVKHFTMQKFMGFGNIPFSITQLMQPLQVHPGMTMLLKNRGLEFSAASAQVKATNTFLNALTGQKLGKLDTFEKSALDYAEKNGILDVKMADHTKDINESPFMDKYHKIADFNITVPERLTRGTSFLFYSHLLKDAGIPAKDIFGAAENMTNFTMVNYHPLERPMGYAKLGWLGDLASTLTRYKHNQASQLAFYTREGVMGGQGIKGYTPMAAFLATSIAFGGVMGFFGFNEADEAYQLITKHLGKPDSLTAQVLGSGMPEILSHGVFSTLGLDMTTRFSNANLLPNSAGQGLIPFGSAVWDMAQATGHFIADPTSMTKGKQLVKAFAPQSVQGILENTMFTEKQPDGRNLYVNNTDGPNLGKGRVYRSEDDMWTHVDTKAPFIHPARDLGFRNIRESKELAKNYSDSQISKAHKDLADGLVEKAKYMVMDGKFNQFAARDLATKAAKYGMSPDEFTSKIVSWMQERHMSQAEQQRFHNAMGGFRGAVNISQGR